MLCRRRSVLQFSRAYFRRRGNIGTWRDRKGARLYRVVRLFDSSAAQAPEAEDDEWWASMEEIYDFQKQYELLRSSIDKRA